jgi:glycogen(starch) synthase
MIIAVITTRLKHLPPQQYVLQPLNLSIPFHMLKVLMFGWEFPPHISGGLGTACHGLTRALADEGVDITFVVPHLTGDEDDKWMHLLDASSVSYRKSGSYGTLNSGDTEEYRVGKSVISVVKVESRLSPYNLAHLDKPVFREEDWKSTMLREGRPEEAQDGSRYAFRGGYGNDLMKEVGRYAQVAREIARTADFDVIHAHDWMTFPAGMSAKEVSGKPLILHVHATEHDRAGNGGSPYVYAIEKEALENADKVISVSNWTRNILATQYRASLSSLEVVHNGIVAGQAPAGGHVHPVGDKLVTFLGRVTYQKGPEYFVDAAQKTLEVFPDSHFVMAGSGDALPRMIHRVAEKKISSNFHFTGFLKKHDIDRLLSYTRVYVMPSVSEPFGITPLEAIQAGVPVIISNQSGVGEVLPDALKVNFWDTDALAQSICSVLRYPSLSNTLRKNGARRISTISWESAAKKVKRIYYETISRN